MYEKETAERFFEKVAQCPNCEGWHSANSPALCHGCATGRAQSGASNGYHPAA